MSNKPTTSLHWSFWAIAALALLFHLMGCMNYISQTNEAMVASMPDAYRAIVEGRPAWATGAFAIAVFVGAIGCVLLLLRRSSAIYAFTLSLIGAIVTQLPALTAPDYPAGALFGGFTQILISAFLIWHTIRSMRLGWLR
jgi:hypothetical protein